MQDPLAIAACTIVAEAVIAIAVLALLWPYRVWIKAHWPHQAIHMAVIIAVSLGISAIFLGVLIGAPEPPVHHAIHQPSVLGAAVESAILFAAAFLTFVTAEKATRRRILFTVAAWSLFGVCLFGMYMI